MQGGVGSSLRNPCGIISGSDVRGNLRHAARHRGSPGRLRARSGTRGGERGRVARDISSLRTTSHAGQGKGVIIGIRLPLTVRAKRVDLLHFLGEVFADGVPGGDGPGEPGEQTAGLLASLNDNLVVAARNHDLPVYGQSQVDRDLFDTHLERGVVGM